MIKFEDFQKLEIKIGTIVKAERVPNTDKLLKLIVDMGNEKRQLIAGIASQYEPQNLAGKQVPVVCNLEPAKIRGVESNGMVLCAATPEPVLLLPQKQVPNGSKVK